MEKSIFVCLSQPYLYATKKKKLLSLLSKERAFCILLLFLQWNRDRISRNFVDFGGKKELKVVVVLSQTHITMSHIEAK